MKPAELANKLRIVASKIDDSLSPRRELVLNDLKQILAGLTDKEFA